MSHRKCLWSPCCWWLFCSCMYSVTTNTQTQVQCPLLCLRTRLPSLCSVGLNMLSRSCFLSNTDGPEDHCSIQPFEASCFFSIKSDLWLNFAHKTEKQHQILEVWTVSFISQDRQLRCFQGQWMERKQTRVVCELWCIEFGQHTTALPQTWSLKCFLSVINKHDCWCYMVSPKNSGCYRHVKLLVGQSCRPVRPLLILSHIISTVRLVAAHLIGFLSSQFTLNSDVSASPTVCSLKWWILLLLTSEAWFLPQF